MVSYSSYYEVNEHGLYTAYGPSAGSPILEFGNVPIPKQISLTLSYSNVQDGLATFMIVADGYAYMFDDLDKDISAGVVERINDDAITIYPPESTSEGFFDVTHTWNVQTDLNNAFEPNRDAYTISIFNIRQNTMSSRPVTCQPIYIKELSIIWE